MKEDKDLEAAAAVARDQERLNQKVLTTVAAFAGSADLIFLKAGGEATFKLGSDLIDFGSSIPRKLVQMLMPQICLIDSQKKLFAGRSCNLLIKNSSLLSHNLRMCIS
jgi:hypothetical protein